jgi:hypothetical protein
MTDVASEQARMRGLLRISGFGDTATAVDPDPRPSDLEADHAIAYRLAPTGVIAAVYSFFDTDDLNVAEQTLLGATPAGRTAVTTSNGTMLLYATGDADDADAVDLLSTLQSNFAGRE